MRLRPPRFLRPLQKAGRRWAKFRDYVQEEDIARGGTAKKCHDVSYEKYVKETHSTLHMEPESSHKGQSKHLIAASGYHGAGIPTSCLLSNESADNESRY